MAVIAVSQQIGSRGSDLAKIAAERLGYTFFRSDDLIAEAAAFYKVTPDQLRVIDERQPHFWEWLGADVERLYTYFRATILRHLAADNAVVAGRTVSLVIPEGISHALRVRIVAPLAARVRNVVAEEKLGVAEAEKRVRDHDRETHARTLRLRSVDINDACNYDLVLNSAGVSLEILAATLCETARAAENQAAENSRAKLRDACITTQVRAALYRHPKIGTAAIEVKTSNGIVSLASDALVPPWDQLARGIASKIEGVAGVQTENNGPSIPPLA